MTFFATFSALYSSCSTLLRNMTNLVASKASSRVAIMVVMVLHAKQTLRLQLFFEAILGNVSLLTTPETLNEPILVVILD
jgi:hypothetical protein